MEIRLDETNNTIYVNNTETTVEVQAGGARGVKGADGLITEVVAGDNISVDNTNPAQPVVSFSGQLDRLTGNGVSFTPQDQNSNFGNSYIIGNLDNPDGTAALYAPNTLYISGNVGQDGSGSFNPFIEFSEVPGIDSAIQERLFIGWSTGGSTFGQINYYDNETLLYSFDGLITNIALSGAEPSLENQAYPKEMRLGGKYIYTASDTGQWRRQRADERDEYVLVKSLDDLPEPSLGLIQLEDNTTYDFNGQINIGTNQLVYGVNSFITGLNYGRDAIIYTGTDAAIVSNGNKVNIIQIGIVAPNGKAMEVDAGTNLLTAFLCGFFSKDGVLVTGASVASFKFCLFQGITGLVTPDRHLTFQGTYDKILLSENPFYPIPEGETAVVFDNIDVKVIDVTGNFFKLGTGNWTGVEWINALDAPTEFGIYQGNTFEGDFTNTVGFDQTTVGWSFTGNSGIPNSRTYGGWGFTGRTTPLTITTQNEWVKIDSGATPKPLERFTYNNSSITYTGRRDVPLLILASITAEVPNNNTDFEFAVYVNDQQVAGTLEQIGFRFSNTSQSLTMNTYIDVSQGDVIDIRCRNLTNADDILISSLSVTANSA